MNTNEPQPHGDATHHGHGVATRRAALLGTMALALSGCVVAPLGAGHGPYRGEAGLEVDVAPPPMRYEVVPAAPGPLYVWIAGHWTWRFDRHVWVSGRWAVPPRGHTWAPGYWDRRGPRWRWHEGHWRRR